MDLFEQFEENVRKNTLKEFLRLFDQTYKDKENFNKIFRFAVKVCNIDTKAIIKRLDIGDTTLYRWVTKESHMPESSVTRNAMLLALRECVTSQL